MIEPPVHSSGWRGSPLIHLVATIAAWIWRWNDDRIGQRPAIGRLTAHTGLVLTTASFLILAGLGLDSLSSVVRTVDRVFLDGFVQNVDAASQAALAERSYYRTASPALITRQARVHTAIPIRPRLEVVTYTVEVGDTAEKIAEHFGLQPSTLLWSNPEMERRPDLLMVGQPLTILPVDGVYHTVELSDTLEGLAEAYRVEVEAITSCPFNMLSESDALPVGAQLIVPGGTKPYEARQVTLYRGPIASTFEASGRFLWPASGILTQGYWYGHRAIDIGASLGTAVRASDAGFVSFAGWTDIGYGYLIVLDHQNGYQTYYAHLSRVFVKEAEVVSRGQVIGAIGSTGNSTGPHLHFEIRYNGYPTNPLIYLR